MKWEEINNLISSIPGAYPENAFYYYTDGDSEIVTVLFPEHNQNDNVGVGRGITEDDIKLKSRVVVAGIALPDDGMADVKNGDSIILGDEEFKVVGVRKSELNEIPHSVVLEKLELYAVKLIMPPGLSTWQRDGIVSFFNSNDIAVTPPRSVLQRTLVSLLLPFIASLFIGIFSVVTFIYLQLYMMEKCKRDFAIMKLCGVHYKYSIALINWIFIVVFTVSYIIGAVVYWMIYQSLLLLPYIIVYVFFIILLLLFLLPYSIRFNHQNTVQDLQMR